MEWFPPRVGRRLSTTFKLQVQELEGRALLSGGMSLPQRSPALVRAIVLERANALSRELASLEATSAPGLSQRLSSRLVAALDRARDNVGHHPLRAQHLVGRVERVLLRFVPAVPAQVPGGNGNAPGDTAPSSSTPPADSTPTDDHAPDDSGTQPPVIPDSPSVTDPITEYTAAAEAWQTLIATPGQPYLILRARQRSQVTLIPGVPVYTYDVMEGIELTADFNPGYQPQGGSAPGSSDGSSATPPLTVVSYTWDMSQAPDALVRSDSIAHLIGLVQRPMDVGAPDPSDSAGKYLNLDWYVPAGVGLPDTGNPPPHLDTITVTAQLSNHMVIRQTYTFYVVLRGADWLEQLDRDLAGTPERVHPYPIYPDSAPVNAS